MASEFSADTKQGLVQGYCDSKFARVADSFVRNFEERGEVGASCVVIVAGEPVVDIWGGSVSRDGQA